MAVFLGGREIVNVVARDEDGKTDEWTVTSSDERTVLVTKVGSQISVLGVGVGDARVAVVTDSGDQRALPVQVYDSTFIDAGEFLIRYADTFECRWYNLTGDIDGSFYQPVVPDGWRALGSLGVRARGCPDIDGQHWMIVVKTDEEDADEERPPLVPPTGYAKEWEATLRSPFFLNLRWSDRVGRR
jgi:hypothetical protein